MRTALKILFALMAASGACVAVASGTGGNYGAAAFMATAAGGLLGLLPVLLPSVRSGRLTPLVGVVPAAAGGALVGYLVFGAIWVGGARADAGLLFGGAGALTASLTYALGSLVLPSASPNPLSFLDEDDG